MNANEVNRVIDLGYAQWPNMEPARELTAIWLAALGEYDFATAVRAVIAVSARRTWPPTVADVVAEIQGTGTDARAAWDTVARLVAELGTAQALRDLAGVDPRAGAALWSVRSAVRSMPMHHARAAFLRAFDSDPDLEAYRQGIEPIERMPELAEFVDLRPAADCLADARRALDQSPTMVMPMATGVGRRLPERRFSIVPVIPE